MMNVSVIGPGAMGCLFAARLADSGVSTTLVDYREDRAERLAKNGIVVESASGALTASVRCLTRVPDKTNLILLLVKSYSTDHVSVPRNIPVLTLQNGLNSAEMLSARIGSANVLCGVTSEAATWVSEGRVKHVSSGTTTIGSWTSCPIADALEVLTSAGFSVEETESPGKAIWQKAAVNAAVNPLTALLNVPNGRLLELREVRQLMRDLVVEATKVAATEGYRFDYSLVEYAEEVCEQTAENVSSMLQDIRAGRQTEIESLSGEILRRGELAMLPAPRTRMIWQLVKGLEAR